MLDKAKYRELFVLEAREHVQILNQSLLKLEKEPEMQQYLDTAFRSAHTLKGMAATMAYEQITELCKTIEDIFDRLRNGQEKLSLNLVNSLFKCVDLFQEMIEDENKIVDLDQYLMELQNPSEKIGTIESTTFQTKASTIRVKMDDLDSLVNLVGELLISKMLLERTIVSNTSDEETNQALMTHGRLISDLQYQTMNIRLVPIEQIFERFPRMVRDLATIQGKEVNLEMEGLGIELDRTVLDGITEPLLHIIRNAVDHGMESPAERESHSKLRVGTIKIIASRMGDKLTVKIEDDGRGIDTEKIKNKAVEKKIISMEKASSMSDDEVLELLGTPGLSSANTVTDISGRGVGLDVVFNKIEDVGGQVKIETKKGYGTSMILTIPTSLAIIGGLLVSIADEKYILPLSSISTTLKIPTSEIKKIRGRDVIINCGQVIPLIYISNVLDIKNHNGSMSSNKITVVVTEKNGKPYGLVIDSFERKREVVMKRIDGSNSSLTKFLDATILPDGKVALVLDPAIIME